MIKEQNSKISENNIDIEKMVQVGLHLGHRTSRINPKMKDYIKEVKGTIHIIDLEKTIQKMAEAFQFVEDVIKEGKIILFVGTKIQIKDLVKSTAEDCGLPYVNERWLGGTLTNFKIILKRVGYFQELEKKYTEGKLEKYTKKEKADFKKEINDLRIKFGGIKDLTKLPDVIFVLDMKKDNLAIREAKRKGIKVVAIADTNVDPTMADYPIPANDDAISSVRYILEKLAEVIKKAQEERAKKSDEIKETKET